MDEDIILKSKSCPDAPQTHVHEFAESFKLAESGDDRHNHRVAGVASKVIPIEGGRDVHVISGTTTCDDGHFHDFLFTE